jgi:protein NEDD1
MKKKEPVKLLEGHSQPVNCVAFSGEGTSVASGSTSGDVLVHGLLSGSATVVKPLRSPQTGSVRAVQYSPFNASTLSSATDDGSVALWDVGMMRSKHHFDRVHTAACTSIAFSPFNHLLLCSAGLDKRILFHDVDDCKTVKEIVATEPISALSFMDDGVTVAVGTLKGTILIYDLRGGSAPKYTSAAHKGPVSSLAFQVGQAGGQSGSSQRYRGEGGAAASAAARPRLTKSALAESDARSETMAASTASVRTADPSAESRTEQATAQTPLQAAAQTPTVGPPSATSTPSTSSPQMKRAAFQSNNAPNPVYNNGDASLMSASQGGPGQDGHGPATTSMPPSRLRVQDPTSLSPPQRAAPAVPFPTSLSPTAAASVAAANATAAAAAALPSSIPGIPLESFKTLIEDSLSQFRQQIHRDVHNMHIDLIRQFEIQKNEMEAMLQHNSVNTGLLEEIEKLRQENRVLQQKF